MLGGFLVDEASTAREAVALALAHSYRLIVTGNNLPDASGMALVARLREIESCRDTPIVLTRSDQAEEDRDRAAGLGVHIVVRQGVSGRHALVRAARELAGRVPK